MLSLTASQQSALSSGLMCSCPILQKTKNFSWMVLNFLQPVHQITVDVNEQSYSTLVVQLTEKKRTHQLSSGCCIQEMVDMLTFLRGPTKRASVWSLFSFSLLPVICLPKESMHCSVSTFSEQKSDGVEDW